MAGRRLRISLLLIYWLAGGILGGGAAFAGDEIAILMSDQEAAYSTTVKTFSSEVGRPTRIYSLDGDIENAPRVMTQMMAAGPPLIFALGAKAAYIAKVWTADHQEIPVIFAMVLNWERYQLLAGQRNMAGIAFDVTPGTQLANAVLFCPNVRRVGVIYSAEHSRQVVERARESARILGLELVEEEISRPHDFQRVCKDLTEKIDAFWILADPVIYTLENMAWLEKKCIKDRLVCIGQSANIVKMGVLLAVDPDVPSIGSQAGAMARGLLAGRQLPADLGIQPPLGTQVVINLGTAERINLPIEASTLDLANTIIDK